MDIKAEFGKRLAEHIKEMRLSQAKAARMCDVGEAHMSRILNGDQNLTLEIIYRICNTLKVEASELIPIDK